MSTDVPRERHAVLIGINYVNDSQSRLYGCINDAVQSKYFLQDAFGYPEDNITVLRDDGYEGASKPTLTNILSSLTQLVNISESCEEIWVHYSGHGSQVADDDGDELDGRDEVMVPCDYRTAGIIRDDVLFSILSQSKCRTYIVMDCCHSGSIIDLPYLFDIRGDELIKTVVNKTIDTSIFENKDIYMIAGSRDSQTAADGWNYEARVSMGATTQSLIETVREHNHTISLEDLLREMHAWMEQRNFHQRPNISCIYEGGISHVLRKPVVYGDVECQKCKEYEHEIVDLQHQKKELETKMEKTTRQSITMCYLNNDLKKRIDRLQTTLNHFTVPEKVHTVERLLAQTTRGELNKERHEDKGNTRAKSLLRSALLRKQQAPSLSLPSPNPEKTTTPSVDPPLSQENGEKGEKGENDKKDTPPVEPESISLTVDEDTPSEPSQKPSPKKQEKPTTRQTRMYKGRRVFMLR